MRVKCDWCGKIVEKPPCQVRGIKHFCNQEHYMRWKLDNHIGRNRVKVVCNHCGKEIDKKPSSVKTHNFCSRRCYWSWRSETIIGANHPSWKGGNIKLKCDYCGVEISVEPWMLKRHKHHFCSKKCKGKWWSEAISGEKHYLWNKVEVECGHCGKKFLRKPAEVEYYKNHFCSRECRGKWQAENIIGEKCPAWRGGKLEVRCDHCGEKLLRNGYEIEHRKIHFCSLDCYGRWLSINKSEENSPFWKGGYSRFLGPNWLRQGRRTRERDNYVCQICGMEENGRALDVHHIIPFREFGLERYKEANQLSNLITLCRPCHVKVEKGEIPIDTPRGMVV